MHLKSFLGTLSLAAAAALLLPSLSTAAPVTRHFEFSSTSGALQFGPTIGSFTYDDSVAPAGGGFVLQLDLFLDLDVAFGGFSFDETTANSGWLRFDAAGGLLDAHFGNNCNAGSCGINGGAMHWWIRVGLPTHSVNDFAYSGYNGEQTFQQTNANRLINVVPEPGTLALVGMALAGLALRRKPR